MKKHIAPLLVISLLFPGQIFSQDSTDRNEVFYELTLEATSESQGIYHEPRWVSWPAAAINFNMLGLAQTGPVVQLDIHLGHGLYLVPSLRYNYLGYASHNLFTFFESDSKYSPAAYGLGIGVRHFFALQKKDNLVFVGLFGEYSHDIVSYNLDSQWESERIRNAVSVVANIGYRWWFRKGFFVHLGIYGGLSFELKDESRYLLGAYKGDLEKDYKNTPFVGLIDFTFGWNL
jgi:hypothetical protein